MRRAFSRRLDKVSRSPLVAVDGLIQTLSEGPVSKLHQGKTYFEPCARPRPWLREEFGLGAEDHAPPSGAPMLRRALSSHMSRRWGQDVPVDQVIVTNGATHAISSVLHAVLEEGDEVLILSPQWLFAHGLVRAAGGVAREVPVFLELSDDPAYDFVSPLQAAVGPRTRAVYFNNPNNPTGFRLDREQLARLVAFAEQHDLWLIADHAYENYDFSDEGYLDVALLPGAAERTFSVHTFSKTYAMPGLRTGYLVTPPGLGDLLTKWGLYTLYSVATASQFTAYTALRTSQEELALRRKKAAEARDLTERLLTVPHTTVQGGLYTFLDLSGYGGTPQEFLHACIAAGVSLAPGEAFGEHCAGWARLCFTAVEPAELSTALDKINSVYASAYSGEAR
ncbi:pyridoxal phosphate-dependent aminotransferase [Streptomyces marokkonensis]|uniref:Pyridoxal phosphate-dependent aminotransferase n=1 Tax=Streptomyces marokkonensis TaxID=324855 RepID=A0ABP7SNC9_9ACTN